MSTDPYAPPTNDLQVTIDEGEALVAQGVLRQLAGTKPWVRFISVMMFIGAGFLLIGAVGMIAVVGTLGSISKGNAMSPSVMTGLGIFYVFLAVIYIFPALKLWKYASRIGALLITGKMMDLETALNEQRSFWKFIGIMAILFVVLYLVATIGFVAFTGFTAMKAKGG